MIHFNGDTFSNLNDIAKKYNIDPWLFNRRIDVGWSIEEAADLIPHNSNSKSKPITVEGVHYSSFATACKAYGINYKTAEARMNKLGWSIDKVFTTRIRRKLKS